jgi:hypothetical protein
MATLKVISPGDGSLGAYHTIVGSWSRCRLATSEHLLHWREWVV